LLVYAWKYGLSVSTWFPFKELDYELKYKNVRFTQTEAVFRT